MDRGTKGLLIETLRSYGVSVCYLFGSRARGDCRADSDVDLGMVFREFRREINNVDMEIEIENAVGDLLAPLRVDVVFLQRASQTFRYEVVTSGAVLYSDDEDFRTDFEYEVVRDYLDFAPVIKEYHLSVQESAGRP
ncbi:MAG: type VII toxin-antitoxin system MntA family adenylyltransferase antitoxin [Ignavibacteriales bacterium]